MATTKINVCFVNGNAACYLEVSFPFVPSAGVEFIHLCQAEAKQNISRRTCFALLAGLTHEASAQCA